MQSLPESVFLGCLQGPSEMKSELLPHLSAEAFGVENRSILNHIFFMSLRKTVAEGSGVKIPLGEGGQFTQPEHWAGYPSWLLSGNW